MKYQNLEEFVLAILNGEIKDRIIRSIAGNKVRFHSEKEMFYVTTVEHFEDEVIDFSLFDAVVIDRRLQIGDIEVNC